MKKKAVDHPLYSTWVGMRRRCRDKSNKHYGAKGISVCDRWEIGFWHFVADMGPRPDGTTLDRYPNGTGNYEPGNCRWATPVEQAANMSSAKRLEYKGVVDTINGWARRVGVTDVPFKNRIRRHGIAAAIEMGAARPPNYKRSKRIKFPASQIHDIETQLAAGTSARAIAKKLSISSRTIGRVLKAAAAYQLAKEHP